jgi:N utilization substance protein A
MKGTRVQAIIRELRGEKIDIVEWSDDPIVFITNAVSPAKIQRVTILDDTERVVEIVVEDSQLSLAIGKKGQNVRLAAKLTGWRIDIKSEDEKRAEVEALFEDGEEAATLTLPGLDDAQLVKLSEAGLDTADLLLETSVTNLAQVAEVDEETALKLLDAVREQVAAAEQAAAEIAETTLEEESPVDSDGQSNSGIQEITVSEGDPAGKDSPIVESSEENTSSVVSDNNSTDPQESETETDSKS